MGRVLSSQSPCRRAFSLIELMVVISLVGLIASLSLFTIRPLYQSYRFRLEADALYELFQELQIEAMTLQSDIHVRFTQKKGAWEARSFSDEPILKSQVVDLSHIEELSPSMPITFYSNGVVRPKNIIKLSYGSECRWINLSGGHLITKKP